MSTTSTTFPAVGSVVGSVGEVVDLAAVERVVAAWCEGLDASVLTGADAAAGAERLAVVIRRCQAAQLVLAGRAEACNAYAARARSAADWLARQNGTTAGQAKRALQTAKRLDACPATRDALVAGEISTDEADAVSEAAVADPGSELRLLAGARANHDLRETRQAADKVRHAARSAEDEAARHARLHRSRALRIGTGRDGHVEVHGQFTPAAFASVKPILDAHLKIRLDQARTAGERDGWDAYRADAWLAAIAAGSTATAPTATTATATTANAPAPTAPAATAPAAMATAPLPSTAATPSGGEESQGRLFAPGGDVGAAEGLDPKVNWNLVVLVDGIALKRGYTAPGETCEIPGVGPIPVAWIHQLLPDLHAELLIHDSVDIRAYATTTRHRTRPVDLAVRVRDRHCTVPRCHHDVGELDHIVDFAEVQQTSVEAIHGMCHHDHDDKTYRGATFARTDTHWQHWPPGTDPATDEPMTAPIGAHLTTWNLDHLPDG